MQNVNIIFTYERGNYMKKNKISFRKIIISLLIVLITANSILIKANAVAKNSEKTLSPIFRVATEEKKVSLTFDINWAEKEYLYDILEVLDKYNVKGTFFIMGGWVNYTEENKEKLIKIKEGGHEIGNHSYIHPSFVKIGEDRMEDELVKTDKTIEETIGIKPKLFRFPSGDYNDKAMNYVLSKGYIPIQWDVDSVDWKECGEEIEYNKVMKKNKPGSIILFHNNAKFTPKNLDRIIKELRNQGYEMVPVGELLIEGEYIIDKNGEQRQK